MYWKKGTIQLTTLTLPFVITGIDFDATLTLVTAAGEDLSGCALMCLDPAHGGYIQAKHAADSEYLPIGFLSDPSCFLGDFAAETESDIDVRVSLPITLADGLIVVNVVLVQNVQRIGPWPEDWPTLWGEDWPELWGEDWP